MNNFSLVFRNTAILAVAEVFIKILSFVWIIFLARTLSVELFGRYNFVNSFVALFSFLPDLGIGLIVIRDIAKHKEKASEYLGVSFVLNTALALFTLVVILISASVVGYREEVSALLLLASLTLVFSTIRSVAVFFFDGTERMHVSATLNSINTVLLLLGGFLGYMLVQSLLGVFKGMLVGTIVSMCISWFILQRYTWPRIEINKNLMKHFLFEGLPLGVAAFSALIYSKIDSVLLAHLLGERAVGIYNSATPFVFALIQLLNVPFVVAVYPALSRLSAISTDRFRKAIWKSLTVIALWSFPAAVLIAFLSPALPLIFGQKYASAIEILTVLIFFVPFASLSALLYKVLVIIKKQKVYLAVSIVGTVLNILLNLFLIPLFGILGAAIASVITQVLLFGIYAAVVLTLLKNK